MKARTIALALLATAACTGLAACSVKFGSVDNSSSAAPAGGSGRDNSFISEILSMGYSSTDMGESYTLDGDFSMLELYALNEMYISHWLSLSDDEQHEVALNFLNFWTYYGDDASIRFKPSELVSGITETLESGEDDLSILDAALDLAVPASKDKYLAIIGVISSDDSSAEDTEIADESSGVIGETAAE